MISQQRPSINYLLYSLVLGADVGDLAPAEGQRELDAADHTLEKSATENIEPVVFDMMVLYLLLLVRLIK